MTKPSTPQRPPLGAAVTVSATLVRRRSPTGDITWEPTDLPVPIYGLYIGYRDVYNGHRVRDSFDEPGELIHRRAVRHALVVLDERTNPIRVPFDALHVIEERLQTN